jgi:hypothetical protein
MKTYRVSRPVLWLTTATKITLTTAAAVLYVVAVSHPTPLAPRLLLLAAMIVFGWLFYVRLPKMPTEIDLTHDGRVAFRSKRGAQEVHVDHIRSIGRGLGRRTVRVKHGGGTLRLPGRINGFYDFLTSVKSMNPAIEIRGF